MTAPVNTTFVDKQTLITADWLNFVNDAVFNLIPITAFGAACDGVTDDTVAFQAAVDSIGSTANTRRSGIRLVIPGPTKITATIVIQQKSFILTGNGWGREDDTNGKASYILWGGSAGSPMIRMTNCVGGMVIENLAFKGKTTSKPSSAIEMNQTAGIANTANIFRNISIGSSGSGDDAGNQFTNGITTAGLNANTSEMLFSNVSISGCSGIGINQGHQQNGNWNLEHIEIDSCAVGLQLCSTSRGSMWTFTSNTVDIKFPALDDLGNAITPRVSVHRYFSEQSSRMLYADNSSFEFFCLQGDFAIGANTNADGKIVFQESTSGVPWCRFELHDFMFQTTASPPAPPYIYLRSKAGSGVPRQIILDGIRGWESLTGGTNGLDITTQTTVDGAFVYLRQFNSTQTGFKQKFTRQDLNGVVTRNLDVTKFVLPYSAGSCRLYDDFTGVTMNAGQWATAIGSDGACAAMAISLAVKGMIRSATGANAGGTMALNGTQINGVLNWQADSGGLTAEFRIKMSAITNVAVYFGFTDQTAALEMPFTLGGGNVLTSNASDAVGVLFDTGADTDDWWLVGVANDVDATKQDTAVAPVAATYEKWRIEISSTGQAAFWRNGVAIGTVMASAVRTGIPLTPIIAAFSRAAASRNVDCDKILIEQDE